MLPFVLIADVAQRVAAGVNGLRGRDGVAGGGDVERCLRRRADAARTINRKSQIINPTSGIAAILQAAQVGEGRALGAGGCDGCADDRKQDRRDDEELEACFRRL